ncbi:hypothetical protein [Phaeobacter gallaeciensis]|uniref:hypothetical protein n=1 Tax=Phaeobacter gallaeciensis TaxID=60890 RepID=UPI00237F197D|nr:hypothetical protein [Phaeobacter gallaeciensis]MDE4191488.1 hypothetical protein [Phaeobacter gallaeciensis]MDE4199951.1 hypothetical protein [Phaeobacter gallaeciensis]MDE4204101.1 hypothetical protein [Phaeobacter gallaeciensis]MDE4208243.1 hypothetical protein [Phaeobacter gallaeciensis]MDE4216508.1 hypothetical protein [Phaeobacter gallaeciensis]
MTNLKTFLVASTAMALAGAAWADSNEAALDQNGSGNTALIDQSAGANNVAGTSATFTDYANQPLLQDGDNNDLTVDQSGDGNLVGYNGNSGSPAGYVEQLGDDNVADIEQTTDGNAVIRVSQEGDAGTGTDENILTILQTGGNNNTMRTVLQKATGGVPDLANTADLSQDGTGNLINTVQQFGEDNSVTVQMTGDGNGTTALSGVAAVANNATFIQRGLGNMINVDIDANNTGIGVEQRGDGNSVGTLDINGDNNEIGIAQGGPANQSGQSGNNNVVAMGVVDGASNIVGIRQWNDDNMATLNIIGASDDNIVDIIQEDAFGTGGEAIVNIEGSANGGDANDIYIEQQAWGFADVGIDGDRNDISIRQFNADQATVRIGGIPEGDDNVLSIVQGGSSPANPNVMNVSIFGDDNNLSGGFSGSALTAAVAATGYQTWNDLQPGALSQQGKGNTMTLTVGDVLSEASGNLFAASQHGNDNTLTGVINGNYNQAVVAQMGNLNTAAFSQAGSGNNTGIIQ